jgi:tetratricopeptide (TPR) repeat protein/transglutaminase-like putative cysteine protease
MLSQSLLVYLLLVASASLPAVGQEKATVKRAPVASDFSKEAYTVEKLSTQITAENDGTGTKERTAEVKILADAGVKAFAVLNFTYSSANESVDVDYVRVRKPDGTVVKTPDYIIQDMPAEVSRTAPLYSDIHEKHVAVKGLSVGDVLEYSIRYRIFKPIVPMHFWFEYSFTKAAIAKDERLELSVPSEKYVKVVSPDYKPEIKQEGARRVYRWAHTNLEVKPPDPDEVPRRNLPTPDVQVTTFASWEDVGRWYGSLQKDPLEVTPAIQAKATELTKGLTTDDDKIHALYNFVALKYHYIGLDFGIGRYQPHPADDVLDNSYGDCKDKHTLLASLLKAVGIEAWPVLINSRRKLDPDVPSPAQFDHVITVVPQGERLIWLDTTPEVAPYQMLLVSLRNKQALVIPTAKPPSLITTPANLPFPEQMEFSAEGKLTPDGTFTGHIEQTYRGDTEVILRAAFRQFSESQWKEAVQRFSYNMNFGGEVSNVKMTPPNDLDKPFELSYDYVRKNYSDWENRQIVAPLPPIGIESYKGAHVKKPSEPILLGALGKLTYRSRVELPEGYKAVAPAPCHLSEAYAEYDDTPRLENDVLTTTRVLIVKQNEVPLSAWEDYQKFGRSIADDEFAFVRLSRTGADAEVTAKGASGDHSDNEESADALFRDASDAVQRRDVMRAQAFFEKVLAKDPHYPGAHLGLGTTFAARFQFDDAIAEFHKEEAVSPQDPRAYQTAASVMIYRGSKDDAIAELRNLLKAIPTDKNAPGSLGELLIRKEKYPEAIEVLEAGVKAMPDDSGLQYQLGDAYLKDHQTEKGVASLRRAVDVQDDDAMMLNNVSYALADNKLNLDLAREYAQRSIDEIDDKAQPSDLSQDVGLNLSYMYSLVWDTLGWVYFQQGDLKNAESFIRSAWLLGEESLVAEHLGEVYEKEGKKELAARAYEMALSVSSAPPDAILVMGPQNEAFQESKRQTDEIENRYEKLMGKRPELRSTKRLPNGEWTQTPAERLMRSREVKFSNEEKLSGSAQFIVKIKQNQVNWVHHVSGDEALKPLANRLATIHYPLEFPPDSDDSVLMVKVQVSCHAGAPCIGTVMKAIEVGVRNGLYGSGAIN